MSLGRIFGFGFLFGLLVTTGFVSISRLVESTDLRADEAPVRFASALEERDPLVRAGNLARLFERIRPESVRPSEVDAIRLSFEAAPLYDGDVEFALLAAWWARIDPAATYEWTHRNPRGRSLRVLAALYGEWGAHDPIAAIAAAGQEAIAVRRTRALEAALLGADRERSEAGIEQIMLGLGKLSRSPERRAALEMLLAARLHEQSPAEVLPWSVRVAERVVDRELAEDLLGSSVIAVAAHDAERAAKALSGIFAQERMPKDVVEPVAASWATQDPVATFEWLATLEPSDEQNDAVRAAYRAWLGRDRAAAIAWAAARVERPEPWIDPIRASYAFILGYDDPEEALRLLFLLPIDDERIGHVQMVFANWSARDPESAEAWLSKADLPDFRKAALRRAPNPAGHSIAKPRRSPDRPDPEGPEGTDES